MSAALDALYRDVVLDHGKRPRNRRRIEGATAAAREYNPLCGDCVTVYVQIVDGVVRDAAFEGQGCVLAIASASLLTETVRGMPVAAVRAVCDAVTALLTEGRPLGPQCPEALAALAGAAGFPSRRRCVLLASDATRVALAEADRPSPRSHQGHEQ